jgi:hypothetical protein
MRPLLFITLLICTLPKIGNAQWSIHADGVYHSTIFSEEYRPNKVRNFGAKLGGAYSFNEYLKADLSGSFYNFNSQDGEYTDNYEDGSITTTYHLYNQTRGYSFEPTLLIYIVPKLLYFKTGPFFGVNQVQSDSGTMRSYNSYASQNVSLTPFSLTYSQGFDRGMIFGSGLQILNQDNISLDFEVLFRFGKITSTKINLIKNEQTSNYTTSYLAFMPSLKLSYNFTCLPPPK